MQPAWKDGEKIPREQLKSLFQQPPDLPRQFSRSGFVIGSQGSGKTTLFRFHKLTYEGLACHLSLANAFGSIGRQAAIGPLAREFTPELERQVEHKAATLFALDVASYVVRHGLTIDAHQLSWCLPKEFRESVGSTRIEIEEARLEAASATLMAFERHSYHTPLRDFFADLGDRAREQHGELLLLIDRADTVPAPALLPLLQLMDQSETYTLLVATRPGHGAFTFPRLRPDIVASDQYDLHHLGLKPYSPEWRSFLNKAVVVQLGDAATETVEAQTVLTLCRDSVRWALALLEQRSSSADSLLDVLETQRRTLTDAVDEVVHAYHPRFRSMLRIVRDQLKESGGLGRPFILKFDFESKQPLFSTQPRLAAFVEIGLRHGGLCMPQGDRWRPGAVPMEVEIPPLFLWRTSDNVGVIDASVPFVQKYVPSEFFSAGYAHEPTRPSLFVAYRMNIPESRQFVEDVRNTLATHPTLGTWKVETGQTEPGEPWALTVQRRVRSAKIVVGDVTGGRPDVMFELGFAYGLGRSIIPAVKQKADQAHVPYWLKALQLAFFGTPSDILALAASIESRALDPTWGRRWRVPQKVPGLAVWLGIYDWNHAAREQFQHQSLRAGMYSEFMDPEECDMHAIRRAASAGLLIVSLDGTIRDALAHYIAGAVVARAEGGGRHRFYRRVIALEAPDTDVGAYCADSLRRCDATVRLARPSSLERTLKPFFEMYARWANSPQT